MKIYAEVGKWFNHFSLINENIQSYFYNITFTCIPMFLKRYQWLIVMALCFSEKYLWVCENGFTPIGILSKWVSSILCFNGKQLRAAVFCGKCTDLLNYFPVVAYFLTIDFWPGNAYHHIQHQRSNKEVHWEGAKK